MVNFDPTTLAAVLVSLLTVAAVTAVLSIGAVSTFLATNRKVRLAQHESIRGYYGSFHLAR
jgi:hypothetical protein